MGNFKVFNKELAYSFTINGEWKELKKELYSKYGLQGSLLHFFMVLSEGKVVKAININREISEIKDDIEYISLVDLNIKNLMEAKFEVSQTIVLKTKEGRRIDKIVVGSENSKLVLYFTHINNIFMSFSTGIKEINDPQDQELNQIVASLKSEK